MPSLRRLTGRDRPAPTRIEAPLALLDVMRDGPAPLRGDGPERAQADRLLELLSHRTGPGVTQRRG